MKSGWITGQDGSAGKLCEKASLLGAGLTEARFQK